MTAVFLLRSWWKEVGFMSNKNAQVCILCEDTKTFNFARRYLDLLGFDSRNIIPKHNPEGRSTGCGYDFVKRNYKKEVDAFHQKNRSSYILIVLIDDDTKNHVNDLYKTYKPKSNERILIFSPNRNIESWFHYIDTLDVTVESKINGEIRDYKQLYKERKPREFATKLKKEICANELPENAPSSLHHACNELNRLKL
jgi:hypothetical protein